MDGYEPPQSGFAGNPAPARSDSLPQWMPFTPGNLITQRFPRLLRTTLHPERGFSMSFANWLFSLFSNRSSRSPKARRPLQRWNRTMLRLEALEERLTPATHIWKGPAGGLWSASANWTGGVPVTGESGGTIVQFPGTGAATSTDNISGLVINEVHFTAGGNTISGASSVTWASTDRLSRTTWSTMLASIRSTAPCRSSSPHIQFVVVTAGTLSLDNSISGNESISLVTGSANGTLVFGGSSAVVNTYTGGTDVDDGTLLLDNNGSNLAIPGRFDRWRRWCRHRRWQRRGDVGPDRGGKSQHDRHHQQRRQDQRPVRHHCCGLNVTDGTASISAGNLPGGQWPDHHDRWQRHLGCGHTGPRRQRSGHLRHRHRLGRHRSSIVNLNGVTRTFTVNFRPERGRSERLRPDHRYRRLGQGRHRLHMQLSGGPTNNYTGTTSVNDGRLELNNNGLHIAIPGNLVVGDGLAADKQPLTWCGCKVMKSALPRM